MPAHTCNLVGQAGYHGTANAHSKDECSLDKSLTQLQLLNNAAMQEYQENIVSVSNETKELHKPHERTWTNQHVGQQFSTGWVACHAANTTNTV